VDGIPRKGAGSQTGGAHWQETNANLAYARGIAGDFLSDAGLAAAFPLRKTAQAGRRKQIRFRTLC